MSHHSDNLTCLRLSSLGPPFRSWTTTVDDVVPTNTRTLKEYQDTQEVFCSNPACQVYGCVVHIGDSRDFALPPLPTPPSNLPKTVEKFLDHVVSWDSSFLCLSSACWYNVGQHGQALEDDELNERDEDIIKRVILKRLKETASVSTAKRVCDLCLLFPGKKGESSRLSCRQVSPFDHVVRNDNQWTD